MELWKEICLVMAMVLASFMSWLWLEGRRELSAKVLLALVLATPIVYLAALAVFLLGSPILAVLSVRKILFARFA